MLTLNVLNIPMLPDSFSQKSMGNTEQHSRSSHYYINIYLKQNEKRVGFKENLGGKPAHISFV